MKIPRPVSDGEYDFGPRCLRSARIVLIIGEERLLK